MSNEQNQTISIKLVGELIIQKKDLQGIFPPIEVPQAKSGPEIPTFNQTSNDSKLPRLAFTAKETAEMLGVSYATIYRLIQRGLLKSSQATSKIIISKVEIERFLKETSRSLYER